MTDPIGTRIERLFETSAPRITLAELGRARAIVRSPRRFWPAMAGVAAVVVVAGTLAVLLRPGPGPLDPGVACLNPPAAELAQVSPLEMSLEPNPVKGGTEATLTVDAEVGIPAEWQCWDGEQWVLTHYLMRGGQTVGHQPGVTITFPGAGVPQGQPMAVVIPNVRVGTYRIAEQTTGGTDVFVFVRVVDVVAPTIPGPTTAEASTTTSTLASTTTTAPPEADNVPFDLGPLQARGGHSVIWTGEEMIVWGGSADELDQTLFADGAAFDPVANTWRMIAPAPLEPRLDHHAVWTGSEMLIVSGAGLLDGAAYDPVSDSWRPIAEAPFSLVTHLSEKGTEMSSSVWTGDELVVWEVRGDRVAAYSLADDTWRVLPGLGFNAVLGVLRWTGSEVIALGIAHFGPGLAPLQAARLQDGGWLPTAASGTSEVRPMLSAWTGSELLAWSEDGIAYAYLPSEDTWQSRDPVPMAPCEGLAEPLEVLDRGVFVFAWCGNDAFYDAGDWTTVIIPDYGDARWAVWTGTEILNWGDTCCYGGGGIFEVRAWRWTPPD